MQSLVRLRMENATRFIVKIQLLESMKASKKDFLEWVGSAYGPVIASECQIQIGSRDMLSAAEGEALLGAVLTRRQERPDPNRVLPFTSSSVDGEYVPGRRRIN